MITALMVVDSGAMEEDVEHLQAKNRGPLPDHNRMRSGLCSGIGRAAALYRNDYHSYRRTAKEEGYQVKPLTVYSSHL